MNENFMENNIECKQSKAYYEDLNRKTKEHNNEKCMLGCCV